MGDISKYEPIFLEIHISIHYSLKHACVKFYWNRAINKVFLSTRIEWIGAARFFDDYSVFTDGSKMDTYIGSGVYIPDKNIKVSYRLPKNCSVFQAKIQMDLKEIL